MTLTNLVYLSIMKTMNWLPDMISRRGPSMSIPSYSRDKNRSFCLSFSLCSVLCTCAAITDRVVNFIGRVWPVKLFPNRVINSKHARLGSYYGEMTEVLETTCKAAATTCCDEPPQGDTATSNPSQSTMRRYLGFPLTQNRCKRTHQ